MANSVGGNYGIRAAHPRRDGPAAPTVRPISTSIKPRPIAADPSWTDPS
jgi:hypothetical protein